MLILVFKFKSVLKFMMLQWQCQCQLQWQWQHVNIILSRDSSSRLHYAPDNLCCPHRCRSQIRIHTRTFGSRIDTFPLGLDRLRQDFFRFCFCFSFSFLLLLWKLFLSIPLVGWQGSSAPLASQLGGAASSRQRRSRCFQWHASGNESTRAFALERRVLSVSVWAGLVVL